MTWLSLREAVLRRLGDEAQQVWTADEVMVYLTAASRLVAQLLRIVWDQLYLENLPRGFSYTQPWERAYVSFDYGCANYTMDDERTLAAALNGNEEHLFGPANHTSPFEATEGYLKKAGASTAIPATVEVPPTLTDLDAAYWDRNTIAALNPTHLARYDSRYETTTGEVYGFTFRKDGVRTFRKVRVPADQALTYTVTGSWGVVRRVTDVSADTVSGTWGVARRVPSAHPMGSTAGWGLARRFYRDEKNVRVDHWRLGRELDTPTDSFELPDRYAIYLRDYAQARCLARSGPGQDLPLSAHFDARWARGLARLQRRLTLMDADRVGILGETRPESGQPPPRPRLPWQFGQTGRP